MSESRLLYEVQPDIHIDLQDIGGDATIDGYDGLELLIVGETSTVQIKNEGSFAVISSEGDCKLRVPMGALIVCENIGGDLTVTRLTNELRFESVGGDAIFRDIATLHLGSVGGDLVLRNIQGDVGVESVGGDFVARQIDGALRMESVGSDIVIKGINGNCQILDIGGDLLLDAPFELPSEHHYASVSGDVVIRIQPNANVSITIPEDVERNIQSRGAQILTSDAETTITLGDGLTEIKIDDISGDFLLQSHNDGRFNGIFDLAENLTDNLIDGLRAGQGWSWEDLSERAHRDAERVRRDAERVAREAERGIRDALRGQEQAERKKNKIEFNFDFDFDRGKPKNKIKIPVGRVPPVPPIPPIPPTPPMGRWGKAAPEPVTQPVTDEERLMILKMVESKQITVEEAERLFAALEGRT